MTIRDGGKKMVRQRVKMFRVIHNMYECVIRIVMNMLNISERSFKNIPFKSEFPIKPRITIHDTGMFCVQYYIIKYSNSSIIEY